MYMAMHLNCLIVYTWKASFAEYFCILLYSLSRQIKDMSLGKHDCAHALLITTGYLNTKNVSTP